MPGTCLGWIAATAATYLLKQSCQVQMSPTVLVVRDAEALGQHEQACSDLAVAASNIGLGRNSCSSMNCPAWIFWVSLVDRGSPVSQVTRHAGFTESWGLVMDPTLSVGGCPAIKEVTTLVVDPGGVEAATSPRETSCCGWRMGPADTGMCARSDGAGIWPN